MITGPSGVGKGTLIKGLLDRVPGLELAVSATTRPPRPGEADGRDYHFLSEEEFEERAQAGDFVEHAVYAGNRYGTLRSELERPGRGHGARDRPPGRAPGQGRAARGGPGVHRAASLDALRSAWKRASDSPEQIRDRLASPRGSWPPGRSSGRWW